jgi:hypothetical protein
VVRLDVDRKGLSSNDQLSPKAHAPETTPANVEDEGVFSRGLLQLARGRAEQKIDELKAERGCFGSTTRRRSASGFRASANASVGSRRCWKARTSLPPRPGHALPARTADGPPSSQGDGRYALILVCRRQTPA